MVLLPWLRHYLIDSMAIISVHRHRSNCLIDVGEKMRRKCGFLVVRVVEAPDERTAAAR